MKFNLPSVTVAIPTYNEANCVAKIVRLFLETRYSNLVEVLIADGGSTDGTQQIVKNLSQEDPRVQLLHNFHKIQSHGLNLIIQHCTGDIFLRADAHSDYAPDYIERCVEILLESKALNVGGATRFVAKTPFQAGVALASISVLGGGNSKHRNPNYDGYADTLFPGCFWTKTLRLVAGYSTEAKTNEDAELNLRLQKLLGSQNEFLEKDVEYYYNVILKAQGATYVSSKIKVWYYPRETWRALFIQYFKYGRGRYLTAKKYSKTAPIRGKLPFLGISGIIFIAIISIFVSHLRLWVFVLTIIALSLVLIDSLRVNWKIKNNFINEIWRGNSKQIPSFLSRFYYCFIVIKTMIIAHSGGYAYQLLRHKVFGINGW